MNLTDREKETLKGMIDRGEPLPPKYKLSLFADAPEVELIWQGKTSEVTNVVLPFQSIEHIDEPRAEQYATQEQGMRSLDMFTVDTRSRRQSTGWTNKLIWGDNKLVLSSLKNGPLRREIEAAGGLKLIYIDPPFDIGADFSFDLDIGGEQLKKERSVIEDVAYRDTWGSGSDSYLTMIYDRLRIIHGLLASDGSVFVHCDWRLNSGIRLILDEVFGESRILNQIAWVYGSSARGAKAISAQFPRNHDQLIWYRKSDKHSFFGDHLERVFTIEEALKQGFRNDEDGRWFKTSPRGDYSDESIARLESEGRIHRTSSGGVRIKYWLEAKDVRVVERIPVGDAWTDIPDAMHLPDAEQTGYATQKPEKLLARVLRATTSEGDLVADFFCGSGTTMAVAEKLGRKWIGCDLGRFAIHTSRKRLINVQRQLKTEGKPYRAFEILNLGKYERQFFVGIDPTLPDDERLAQAVLKEENYLALILGAYGAERVESLPHVQGRKGNTLVAVGPIDAPVTIADVHELVAGCVRQGWTRVDILAFEFEMGTSPFVQEEARARGVTVGLKYIPKDVFDKRAVERGQVQFYDVAYVEAAPAVVGRSATVTLTDFSVFYGADDPGALFERVKPGKSQVLVRNGQVVRITRDKAGAVIEEQLTKHWTDWIDYWAVDFEFESKPEVVRILDASGEERDLRTGNHIFENEWQSFRTRKDRSLELTSAPHAYPAPGPYKIAVKVIDIFGNDTTKVFPVEVS